VTFTTRKTSYAPITISAAELAQANASARKLYDAISAEQDAWLAARMARDAEHFFGPSPPGWSHQGFVVGYDPGSPDGDIGVVEIMRREIDPLDVEYDGNTLRELLVHDEIRRREEFIGRVNFTPAQRSAISAHWSAELRAKVDATKQKAREQVVSDYDEDRP